MNTNDTQGIAGDYSGDKAKTYFQRRFESSSRMRRLHQLEMEFAKRALHLAGPDPVVLDMPCGSGRFLSAFSSAKKIYGIDLSEDMLVEAKKNAPQASECVFMQGSATQIPIADNSVDLVFCMRLLHHVGDSEIRNQIFRELARVTRRWVATSFYRKESIRYYRKFLLGKKVSGQPIKTDLFLNEALECGLKLVDITPKKSMAYLNSSSQTLVLFEIIT